MVDVQKFLANNYIELGVYALVTYENKVEPTWFTRYNDWFLESPCELHYITEIDKPIDEFFKSYANTMLKKDEDKEYYIEKYIKPMIMDNVLYEIENFQCSPYLPKRVDDIKLITERQCLEYILRRNKNA